MVYGKEYNVPRMVAAYGDAGVKYTYSRRTLGTLPWVGLHFLVQQFTVIFRPLYFKKSNEKWRVSKIQSTISF